MIILSNVYLVPGCIQCFYQHSSKLTDQVFQQLLDTVSVEMLDTKTILWAQIFNGYISLNKAIMMVHWIEKTHKLVPVTIDSELATTDTTFHDLTSMFT